MEDGSRVENLQAQRCRARFDHLESAYDDNTSEWNNTRVKRILVDYMLRMSYYDTATKFAEGSNIQVFRFEFVFLCFLAIVSLVSCLYRDLCLAERTG